MPAFEPTPYAPRPTRCVGVVEHAGWRLKRYAITAPGAARDDEAYDDGVGLIVGELPGAPVAAARPGVGFLICNTGLDADRRPTRFLSVFWWDNHNELRSRMLIRSPKTGDAWARDEGVGLACVWDMLVMEHERSAFVRHLLCPRADADAYLADTLTVEAESGSR